MPRASASPCTVGLTRLEAFAQRLADDLASLRPLATAEAFDSGRTVAGIRRVSATLTIFDGLGGPLGACEATADLGNRVESLMGAARSAVEGGLSASVQVAQVQRDTSVTLFGLLPEVLDVSDAAKVVANDLALRFVVARLPDEAIQPIGSLAPLPTPIPKPTPKPTPKPAKVATVGASFFGSGTRVTTYRVTGTTAYGISGSMTANGPYSKWRGGTAAGLTKVTPTYRFGFSTDGYGGCQIVTTATPAILLRYTVVLPRWSAPAGASATSVRWWNGALLDIATHEKVHVDIYKAAAKRLNSSLAASTCANASGNLAAVWDKAQRQNCQFDMKEYGTASGLSLAACVSQ